jgi:hypothetical protein
MSLFKSPTLAQMPAGGPIYMVFKYIPDMIRMEPRNIGVMLWNDGAIAARFLDKPDFVTSESAYAQWIDYWSKELKKMEITSAMTGEKAPVTSPRFLEVLQESSKGNFYLALGGQVLQKVDDVQDAVEYLFKTIVL